MFLFCKQYDFSKTVKNRRSFYSRRSEVQWCYCDVDIKSKLAWRRCSADLTWYKVVVLPRAMSVQPYRYATRTFLFGTSQTWGYVLSVEYLNDFTFSCSCDSTWSVICNFFETQFIILIGLWFVSNQKKICILTLCMMMITKDNRHFYFLKSYEFKLLR